MAHEPKGLSTTDLKALSILPSEAKTGKIVSAEFFSVDDKIDTTPLKREHSCIICPNVENFCPNNSHFSRVGDVTASPASPCRTLMEANAQISIT